MLYGDMVLTAEKGPFFEDHVARSKTAEAFWDNAILALMARTEQPRNGDRVTADIGRFTAVYVEVVPPSASTMTLDDKEGKLPGIEVRQSTARNSSTRAVLSPHELKTYEAGLVDHPQYPFRVTDSGLVDRFSGLLALASYLNESWVDAADRYRDRTARVIRDYYDEHRGAARSIEVFDYDQGQSSEGNTTNFTLFSRYGEEAVGADLRVMRTKAGNILAAVQTHPVGGWGSAVPFNPQDPEHGGLLERGSNQFSALLSETI